MLLSCTLMNLITIWLFFFNSRQIYWLGDLNYRITDLSTNHVRTLVTQKEYDTLLKVDQLSQQRERGNVLLVRSLFCYIPV